MKSFVFSYIAIAVTLLGIGVAGFIDRQHTPRFRAGDCVDLGAMTITEKGEWDSSGYTFGEMQIIEVIHTTKMDTYMAERLHARNFYKIRISPPYKSSEEQYKYLKTSTFVIPVEDLDHWRYADKFWELPENNTRNCNSYSTEK